MYSIDCLYCTYQIIPEINSEKDPHWGKETLNEKDSLFKLVYRTTFACVKASFIAMIWIQEMRALKKREMIYLDRGDIVGGRGNWVTSRFQGYKKEIEEKTL